MKNDWVFFAFMIIFVIVGTFAIADWYFNRSCAPQAIVLRVGVTLFAITFAILGGTYVMTFELIPVYARLIILADCVIIPWIAMWICHYCTDKKRTREEVLYETEYAD